MLLTSLPEILFLKRHGLKGLYSWGVSWGVAYVPTMQLKKLATMGYTDCTFTQVCARLQQGPVRLSWRAFSDHKHSMVVYFAYVSTAKF